MPARPLGPRPMSLALALAFTLALLVGGAPPIGAVAPDAAPGAPAARPAAQTSINLLVVLAPGIDISLGTASHDPYQRAGTAFAAILQALGCQPATSAPPAGTSPLVPCRAPTIGSFAWVPYSYAGASGTCPSGAINPYTGQQTGQPIEQSVAALQAVVQFARGCAGVGASVPVWAIGHSLGGAVASYWGADHQDAFVLTLDSPVNGIWNPSDLAVYCQSSVGLSGIVSPDACHFAAQLAPVFVAAPIVAQLNSPAVIRKNGQANAANLANPADLFVPSWYALNPAAPDGNLLLPSATCANAPPPPGVPQAPIQLNHTCVLVSAAGIVAQIVHGVDCPGCELRPRQQITVTVCGLPASATLSASRADQPIAISPTSSRACPGGRAFTMPWTDALIQVSVGRQVVLRTGVLPALNQDLTVTAQVGPTPTPTPVIPEFSPLWLFASGLLALGLFARRQRRRGRGG